MRISIMSRPALWLVVGFMLAVPVDHAFAIDPDLVSRTLINYFDSWSYLTPESVLQDPALATNQDFHATWGNVDYDVSVPLQLPNGSTLAWQGPSPAPFQYGAIDGFQGLDVTTLPLPASGQRYTQYFRREFEIDGSFTGGLSFNLVADDGAVVRIDGVEVFRMNCCTPDNDPPEFTDLADGSYPEQSIIIYHSEDLDRQPILDVGTHVITVEVHNASNSSSDLGFLMRVNEDGPAHLWDEDASGEWLTLGIWDRLGVPDSNREIAVFGDVITAPRTVVLDEDISLRGLEFDSPAGYTVAGLGRVTFDSQVGASTVDVLSGDHDIQLEVAINNATDVRIAADAAVSFNNTVFLQGEQLTVLGEGSVEFNNAVVTDGGSVVMAAAAMTGGGSVDGSLVHQSGTLSPGHDLGTFLVDGDYHQSADAILEIEIGGNTGTDHDLLVVEGLAELAGRLSVQLVNSTAVEFGDLFHILDAETISGTFSDIDLPQLASNVRWDISRLYTLGTISVVPEPSGVIVGTMGLLLAGFRWQRRSR